ncbi:MAG: phenylacetate--CoA ligase family protein [Candidatus Tectomicrobia bacterium]|nr:phenylacetate--CoA ligase family protein [Candidatus Tectomicrobia bacterium]
MDAPYLHPDVETLPRQERRRSQAAAFARQLAAVAASSPFYQRKFAAVGIHPSRLPLERLTDLPFTTKDELKADQEVHAPWGEFLAAPLTACVRLHQTSATTGRPLLILESRRDWQDLSRIYARALYAMGVRSTDMVLPAFSFGPWVGFWGGVFAIQELGALFFPSGGMSTEQRIDTLLSYPITVLGCTPSYGLHLAEAAAKRGIDLATRSRLRLSWHTGEPGASIPTTRALLARRLGTRVFDLPGLTEIAPWGFSCAAESGQVHLHEDVIYAEVLDVESERPVGPGERGELILTHLRREAMPFIRYRTRDLVEVARRPCPCGRTFLSFQGGVLGRLDDLKKIRGVLISPAHIEEVVRGAPAVSEFEIVLRRLQGLDDILVRLEAPEQALREGLLTELAANLRLRLGLRVTVEAAPSGSLRRWDHKARRLRDERQEVPF